jgi:hypothetical protein
MISKPEHNSGDGEKEQAQLPHLQIQPADVKIDTWQPSAQHLTDYYFI